MEEDLKDPNDGTGMEIAVVGLAGRFPGAPDVEAFWQNLREGVESITFFDAAGGGGPAFGVLDGIELFDAGYFGYNPREAEIMDPQHRIFLELAVEALERAGYTGGGKQVVGVYAGASENSYFLSNLFGHSDLLRRVGGVQVLTGVQRDFLATRVSYKLDLRGPSLTVQTACSTSLVAVHLACQGLLSGECDVALAGGVTVRVPQRQEEADGDGLFSPDGHCRAFDAAARGTVGGNGAGVVVLRRLADALADGDTIEAVIKGSVVNNDGALKAGFTTPSVDGQATAIRTAQLVAEVEPETVTYIEAHGTATPVGDPIEVAALTQAFDVEAPAEPFCALASVKTNLGHLDAAAGVAGLIKTVLAIKHGELPPSLGFERPNPQIDFASTPFFVNSSLRPWAPAGFPRRAGVSAFGMGGTNAHAVLEEAPPREPSGPSRDFQLLVLSAHTESALETLTDNLAERLRRPPDRRPPDLHPADVAYTLQVGRSPLRHRRVLVSSGLEDAAEALAARDPRRLLESRVDDDGCEVFFLFSGLGEQYAGMGRELYEQEPTFRQAVDRCCEILTPRLGTDLRELLLAPAEESAPAGAMDLRALRRRSEPEGELPRTEIAQPAVFVIGYALTQLWQEWGVHPRGAIGYSLGEYLAALTAGVFSLEDALGLVAERARLIGELPEGRMLAVPLSEEELSPLLGEELGLAAVNAPSLSVAAGPTEAVTALRDRLAERGTTSRMLATRHAFHSSMMEPIAARFREVVAAAELSPPRTPFVSNVTGTWIRPEEAVDPGYWVRHLTGTVRFRDGVGELLKRPGALLELGPGQTLCTFVRQHASAEVGRTVASSLPAAGEGGSEVAHLLRSLGLLWLSGAQVDWSGLHGHERRGRVPLPTYPFERRRYWIEPVDTAAPETLPEPAEEVLRSHERPRLMTPFVPPGNALEAAVAGIWHEVLGLVRVGVHDDFFELGGHSLLATRVLSRLREALGAELTLGQFFRARTVAELARLVGELRGFTAEDVRAGIPRAECRLLPGGERVAPLSFAQQRLWFLDQLVPGNAFYNLFAGLRLLGPLRPAALAGALAEVVRRHETQRTTFSTLEEEPVQVVHPPGSGGAVPAVDLGTLPAGARQAEARRLIRRESRRPFDLGAGPLLRSVLLRLDAGTPDRGEHVLALVQHHIVSDGWSAGILYGELTALYDAACAGAVSPLPEPEVQYADFAVWQREYLSGERLAEQLGYWKDRLGATPPEGELPADRPRPQMQAFRGAGLPFEPEASLRESLHALGRDAGATLAMTLLAAFDALLFRMTGREKVVVGTPIAGRDRPQLEGLLGFFVNTLVMVGEVGGDPSFRELLERVRDSSLDAYAHQDLPFEKLVEELELGRDLSRNPLFQVVLALQNAPLVPPRLTGLEIEPLPAEFATSRLDLELHLIEDETRLFGLCLYDTTLFDATTVARLLAHYQALLLDAAASPEKRLTELSWLTAAEEHQLRAEWNDAPETSGEEVSVAELVALRATESPDAPALVFEEQVLGYGELLRRSRLLAHHLRELGVGPEVVVGVLTGRSPEMVLSYLAVLLAGGAYLPLDPELPVERLLWMLRDSAAPVLLTTAALADRMEAEGVRQVVVEAERPPGREEAGPAPSRAENAAYVLYTSGSTGRPKGVVVTHGSLLHLVRWHRDTFRLTPADRSTQTAAVGFDATVLEIWPALASGASLYLPPEETRLDPEKLFAYMATQGITVAFLSTPLAQQVAAESPLEEGRLRVLLTGGDVLRPVPRRLPFRLFNCYGPTENTVVATAAPVDTGRTAPPIGRPLSYVRTHVVDGQGALLPAGVAGELWLSGKGLARGYLHRGSLSAERFVPDPFGEQPGGRVYRTGDLVRQLADGNLEFLGRLDHQVKVRGLRIELGEVEAALAEHPAVREAVVTAPGEADERRLVAYVTPTGPRPDVAELREALRRRLPGYMVPAAFVVLEAMPLLPSGKVDRRALPAPGGEAPEEAYVAPRTPAEEVLAEIWSQVLPGHERIGVMDDFFALGGHSLLATKVISRIRRSFGVDLAVRELFEAPTVAALARRVEAARRSGEAAPDPGVRQGAAPPPLSLAQQRFWFLDRLLPGNAAYNIPLGFRLRGRLAAAALERSLNEAVRRHETLRTTFAGGGEPVQRIHPPVPRPLPAVDLTALGGETREAVARRLTREEAGRPFDLESGPLFRSTLLRLGAEDHVLLLTVHHIVFDGWSAGILQREMTALYGALASSAPYPELPELTIQYADFAVWQRERLDSSDEAAIQLAYWRSRLDGVPAVLELPTDRPRRAAQRFRGALSPFRLPAHLTAGLRALGQRQGATPAMVILAGFFTLLFRRTHQETLVVGSPVAGRNRHEAEDLIGCFVNTLAMVGDLSGRPTFQELVDRVRETTLDAYAHQDLPFEQLVEALELPRDLSRNPLFQVVLVVQNASGEPPELPGLVLEPLPDVRPSTRFDLEAHFFETGPEGALEGFWAYDADLFDATTVRRTMLGFETLLAAALEAPATRLRDLVGLTAAERQQLREWNDTRTEESRERTIPELFEIQAERTPDAVALVGETSWTYAELDRRADRWAHRLRQSGVGPETAVAVCLERSVDLVTAFLAVLKAGGAYVPLDPELPGPRLEWMLRDSRTSFLLTRRATLPAEPTGEVRRIDLDDEAAWDAPASRPAGTVSPASLAYVMYTSGSTGQPKGTAVPHRGVVRLIRGGFMELNAREVFLQLAPTSFDASTLEIWGPLLHGGRVVVPPPGPLSLVEVGETVRRYRVTSLWLTAGLFHQMVETDLAALTGLRYLVAGGDVLSPVHVRKALGELPGVRLINGYGPTESTTFAACHPLAGATREPVPIGRPIAGTGISILDPELRPVPPGVPGELAIRGDGLARGYRGRPGRSAERFVPDPLADVPGSRVYLSGDLARHLADGTLEFLGRFDRQVKIRGFRVEPGEVEAALCAHPAVREAVAMAREERGDRFLVAYVTPADPDRPPAPAELREELRRELPGYLVPAAVVVLAELPLSPQGKVDRKALPAPEGGGEPKAGYTPPRSPAEEMLALVWEDLLGISRVGVDDDFFARGGHSLLAIRMVSRVRDLWGVELPVRALFETPTLGALARRLHPSPLGAEKVFAPIPRQPRDGNPLPLSFAQQRLWFLERLAPGSASYSIPGALLLTGELRGEALRRAFETIVARHEALRTTFTAQRGAAVQMIAPPPSPWPLPRVDLRAVQGAEGRLRQLLRRETARGFDLERGPLFRTTLFQLEEHRHVLLFAMHHIVSDGWSVAVLVRELGTLYTAFRDDRPSPALPELAIQYADFAVWQRQWLSGRLLEEQLAYWKEELAGTTPLDLPSDRPRPSLGSHRGSARSSFFPPRLLDGVRRLARREGTTLFMTLLAAFKVLLSRYSGQTDIAVGTPVANRNRSEIEDLVGFFVNTLVLRSELRQERTFQELLSEVREVALAAYACQDLPFERLVAELPVDRDLSRTPLFQVMLTFQNAATDELRLPGLDVLSLPVETGTSKFDLTLSMAEAEEGLAVHLEYCTDLFDATTLDRMARHFETLLTQFVREPEQRIAEPSLLTAGERHQVAVEWNDTHRTVPAPELVHELTAAADRDPEAVAVRFRGAELTYGELDARANRLAHHLRALGVGPEVRVALMVERSFEMMVGLLAVLKAGGAYVPLDPEYPQERLDFMAADAGAKVLLTLKRLAGRLQTQAEVVLLDADEPTIARQPATPPVSGVRPENLVYVIYTSGSTGRPKGAMNTHRGVVNRLRWMQEAYPLDARDRVLQKTPISFDVSVWELFWPLMTGACQVIAEPGAHRDPTAMIDTVLAEAVTTVHFVPSMLGPFLDHPKVGSCRSLRRVILSGEALSGELEKRFFAHLQGTGLHNLYGPTEAAVDVTRWPCAPGASRSSVPIGRGVENTRVHVLGGDLRPRPAGLPGELCIGGVQLARGYLARAATTAERFIPDPLSDAGGERLYRTGDLVRHLADGNLEFLGRMDHQVKVRGLRIELGEVEAALARQGTVRSAVVVARDGRLVAYVVPKNGGPPEDGELRRELGRTLPEHMVPGAFVTLEELPLTPNGKVDRRALPLPESLRRETPGAFEAPGSSTERSVAALWSQVLKLPKVGVHDNFFELGGHSLLMVEVQAALRETWKRDISIVELFRHPTVAALARRLDADAPKPSSQKILENARRQIRAVSRQKRRAKPREPRFVAEPAETHEAQPAVPEALGARSLYEAFAVQVARTPGAVALTCDGEQLTYAELAERAGRVTRRLLHLGAAPEARIGLFLERSPEMVAAVLGVLGAGATYVPLDVGYPAERVAYILKDGGVPVLLTQRDLLGRLPEHGAQVVCLDDGAPVPDAAPVPPEPHPENLAYVIYTSGSTGKPKGVAVTHGNVLRLFSATAPWFGFGPDDVWTLFHSIAFDFSVWEVFGALLHGGRLVIVPWEASRSFNEFHDLLCREQVSVLNQTPSAFEQLSRVATEKPSLPPLRWVIFGGEALTPPSLVPWRQRYGDGGPRWINMYGITETTVHVTYHPVSDDDLTETVSPIGRPIPDLGVVLLDERFLPVPAGETGQIFVSGAGLARGYLGRPGLTAERFLPDPFTAARGGGRMYRTGDLARQLADGRLEYLGRTDHQVKVRGFRIELGEIEAVLGTDPGVRACCVVPHGSDRLVAYVVASAPARRLRQHLRSRLPDYMVPALFVALPALPRLPGGKVDRAALARHDLPAAGEPAAAETAYVAPRTPVEELLAGIWSELLSGIGRRKIGAGDNFFALGGHSLLATQVLSRIEESFAVELAVRELFEAPTLSALAALVEAALPSSGESPARPPLVPRPGDAPPPLSFAQQRLWILDRLAPQSASYNVAGALRLLGPLHVSALERSLTEIVRRHETLRTTFAVAGGDPVQVIHEAAPHALPRVDLTALEARLRESEAWKLGTRESARSFDLGTGPLFRSVLLRLDAGTHVLLLNQHHIISDGWSIGVFQRELATLYEAFCRRGEPRSPVLPDLAVQYADFAVWQRQWLREEVLAKQLAYWKKHLGDAPSALELPTDRPRRPVQRFRGAVSPIHVSAELHDALHALARQEGATLAMTLLAVLFTFLYRVTGQRKVLVGTVVAGRNVREVEDLIGFFVNHLTLAGDPAPESTFRELTSRVRETALQAYAHQDLPFEKLVGELSLPRDMSRSPLSQVIFAFQNAPVQELEMAGLKLLPFETGFRSTRFDLEVHFGESPEGLFGGCAFDQDLFDTTTVGRWLGHFQRLLQSAVADPGSKLRSLAWLGAAEEHQLLEANDTAQPYPRDLPIHRVFAAQVQRHSDRVAVELGDEKVSYGELDRRANRVAHRLRELGVVLETPVVVLVERSVEMVVGFLAALKAGGAYVPLDPSYPEARLRLMLDDVKASVVLTQRHLAERLPEGKRQPAVLFLDDPAATAALPDTDPGLDVSAEQVAYIMYTSGSTGRPKGVRVPHRALVRLVMGSVYSEHESMLQLATISFDASALEIWTALLNGARLAIFPHLPSFADLGRFLRERSISSLFLTPALFQPMVADHLEDLRGVRTLITGGDVMPATEARRAARELGCRVLNLYGPTEGGVAVTAYQVDGDTPVPVPIGRAISNTRLYVTDRFLQPMPLGLPGELLIGGDCVARDYLDRRATTAERFVPDPYSEEPGARLYRTGDAVRVAPGGEIDFLGRIDRQVKVRGVRIEPAEIEEALAEHPEVRQAVVVVVREAQSRPDAQKRLAAYLTAAAGSSPAPAELRRFLEARLPRPMVPSHFVVLERFPVTPSGKLDRDALPRPTAPRPEGGALRAPTSELERRIAAVWSEVLGVGEVSLHENFFDLGGHSLAIIKAHAKLAEALEREIPIVKLFEHATVASLSEYLEATEAARASAGEGHARAAARRQARTQRRRPRPASR